MTAGTTASSAWRYLQHDSARIVRTVREKAVPVLALAFSLAFGLAFGTGCSPTDRSSDEPSSAADTATMVSSAPAPRAETREGARANATRVLGAADAGCPLAGDWQLCSVEDRLVRAGLAPQRADSAPAAELESVETARYWLGDVEAQVFIYADAGARARAEREAGSALGEQPLLESARDGLRSSISSANMAVVLYGSRPRQVERVTLALSGGLPDR